MSSSLTESQSADKPLGLSERQCPQRTPKSQVHPRPPSATGGRSRIPTNVHRNSMSGADSHGNLESPRAEAQKDSGRRLASKSFNSTIPKKPPNPPSGMQRRQLENQLHVKKNKYATLKKELMEKQKTAIEMYEDVVQLREKLIAAGGKDPGRIDAIQLLGGQTLHSPGGGEMTFVVDSTVTNEFVSNIQLQLDGTSKNLFDVCQDTLTKYSKVLHRLMSSRDQSREADAMLELKEFEVDHENLVTRLEAARKVEDELRSNVMGKVAILWSEIEACRIRIKHLENAGDDMVNQLRAKLNSEVEKLRELKERKSAVDGQLQKAKLRIKELEGKVEEEETKISQLQGNVKNLEGQLKHKDINGEQRLREVQKLLKNSEATVVKLENQRDSLESRLIELKKDLSNTEQVELLEKIIYLEEKSEILEKQLETLHPELSTCQQRVEHFVNEKLNIENHFQTKLEEKSNEIKDLQLNIETLERERDSFKQKVKDLESAPPVAPTSPRPQSKQSANPESENISYGSLEILKVNDGLRRNITDLKRTLKEVESELNTRSTQLQQKEKLLREQAKQLKIRDEMLAVMQGNRDKGNLTSLHKSGKDLVGKASLEELYSTLEDKQTQLVHLEKMVKQMEDQEKRAQEQRTRQEKRIAQLELTLQNKKNENRYVTRGESQRYSNVPNAQNISPGPPSKALRTKSPSVSFTDRKIQRSKTVMHFLPSNKFASWRDYESSDGLDFTKILDLERKYYECAQAEDGFESFYQWLMTDPSRNSRYSCPFRYDKQPESHNCDKKYRNQCGRESRSSRRHPPQCQAPTKIIKHRRTSSKDPDKQY